MIYKTKETFYTMEKRLDNFAKIKARGTKIVVNKLVFYVSEDKTFKKWIVTEKETGLKVLKIPFEDATIEGIEKYLEQDFETIVGAISDWKTQFPNMKLMELEDGEPDKK